MSDTKIIGCCSTCDKEVFDVVERYSPDSDRAGQPKRLGAPTSDAVRIGFLLANGEHMDLTFCQACADSLIDEDYAELWQKVLRSWVEEIGDKKHPDWLHTMLANSILCEVGKQNWTEVMRHAH